jgi:hypothetical protein
VQRRKLLCNQHIAVLHCQYWCLKTSDSEGSAHEAAGHEYRTIWTRIGDL